MSRRALVVMGSRTSEDKYGITSGLRVIGGLRHHGWDVEGIHASQGVAILSKLLNDPGVVVPVGFGSPCEDGHIFAVARMAGVPCAGPTPGAGSLMQDKSVLNMIVDAIFPPGSGVRSPRGHTLTQTLPQSVMEARVNSLRPPLVVKPAFSGSSEGLLVVDSPSQALDFAVASIRAGEGKVLVQELEVNVLAEVSCTVLDDESGPNFLPIVELRRDDVLVLGPEEKFGSSGLGRHIIPARLDSKIATKLESVVLRLQEVVGAVGLTRTDVLITESGELVMLELNAIPGLLDSSIACDAAAAAGIPFDDLCVRYAESAFLPRPEPSIWAVRDREFSVDR